jgi:hypothetical protein
MIVLLPLTVILEESSGSGSRGSGERVQGASPPKSSLLRGSGSLMSLRGKDLFGIKKTTSMISLSQYTKGGATASAAEVIYDAACKLNLSADYPCSFHSPTVPPSTPVSAHAVHRALEAPASA